jgi:hypothetical protein
MQFPWEIGLWFESQAKDEILTPEFVERLLEIRVQAELLEKIHHREHCHQRWREKVDMWVQAWIVQWIKTTRE